MRGTGQTTKQMREAPRDAIYVWVNSYLDYPRSLARFLGREDLKIVSPGWLCPQSIFGGRHKIVLDHATVLNSPAAREAWRYYLERKLTE